MIVNEVAPGYILTECGGIVRVERVYEATKEIVFFELGPRADAFLLELDAAIAQDRVVPFLEEVEHERSV